MDRAQMIELRRANERAAKAARRNRRTKATVMTGKAPVKQCKTKEDIIRRANEKRRFDDERPANEEITRVADRIGPVIKQFFVEKGVGYEFSLHEITLYVMQQVVCSPTSPYRIMAMLSGLGEIDYMLMSRKESLYKVMFTGEQQ